MKTKKTLKEINQKIKNGEAVVVRADEMPAIFDENPKRAVREVDVVTTGTFGAMCSSGVFLNFGHSDPPIKMNWLWLNDVEAYTGLAAVDAYLGATQSSVDKGIEYGGGHVIEDLVAGKEIQVRARSRGTDCYPRKEIETRMTLEDMNQAVMFNPRNCYQRYNAAINSGGTMLHTYMGTLLSGGRNISFAGTGEISPLNNDPDYETIGFGTRIFLGGAMGFVACEGTQHSPKANFATLAVEGNLKEMSTEFIRGATIPGYGTTLFVGIGIPIPILNEGIARKTAIQNKDIMTNIVDYSVPRLNRPVIKEASYEELISGSVEIDGKQIRASPLSSFKVSFNIMDKLKELIESGEFFLSGMVKPLSGETELKPMKLKERIPFVDEIMTKEVITAHPDDSITCIAELLVNGEIDQIPIVDTEDNEKLVGIVSSWDITKALARHKEKLRDIMTKKVITSRLDEPIDVVSIRFDKHGINSTPVIDEENRVIGIITTTDISKVLRRGVSK